MHEIRAVRGQLDHQVGIGVVRVEPRSRIFVIVIQGQDVPGGIGQLEHRVEGRIQTPRRDFGDDGFARQTVELEHVPVAGLADATVDDDWQLNLAGLSAIVVRLLFDAFGQVIDGEGYLIGDQSGSGSRHGVQSGRAAGRRQQQLGLVDIPALHFDRQRLACSSAQRKDRGDKRLFGDRHPVNKIFASAEDGVGNRQHVLAVLRDLVVEHRIRLETVIVVVGDFPALGVVERNDGLEPTRHGVGNVRQQMASVRRNDQPLPLLGFEPVVIDLSGGDLTVDDARHGHHRFDFLRRPFRFRAFFFAKGRQDPGFRGLSNRFGKLTDVEHHRVRKPGRSDQTDFTRAGLRVRSDRQLDKRQAGKRPVGGRIDPLAHARLEPVQNSLLRRVELGTRIPLLLFLQFALQDSLVLPHQRDLLVVQPAPIIDDFRLDPRSGDNRGLDAVDALPAQTDLDGRSLLPTRRIDEPDVGLSVRGGRRQHADQCKDQNR